MHAKITAYRGTIVCELLAAGSIPKEVASTIDNPGNLGQVIMNTAKNLGVSAEALELLKRIKRGHDAIGDVDWFSSVDGNDNFAWFGGPISLKEPATAIAARGYRTSLAHIVIDNEVREDIKAVIDEHLDKAS